MKDKRTYLKLAYIIQIIYILIMSVYYIFFTSFNDEVIANLFFLLIGMFFAIIIYKESKKDISYLKDNKLKILIAGIWMFLEPIIPGVLCFLFLNSLKDKKNTELPLIKEKRATKSDIIKSIIAISTFILLMFVLPNLKVFKLIPPYFIYAFIFIIIVFMYYQELKNNFKIFICNIRKYIPFIIKRYFIMLSLMIVVAVPIVLLNNGSVSSNQEAINVMFKKVPIITLLLSCFYAPFAEEVIFRLSLSKLISNKKMFIITSGFLFGLLHVIDKFTSFYDFLYVFQYATLGMCLAKAYKDTNNIFVSISIHFIQNFLAAMLVLLLY